MARGMRLPMKTLARWQDWLRRARLLAGLATALLAGAREAQAAPAQRIVSLNVCVDQILIDLVPRERIAAVTHLAADPLVSVAPEAFRGVRATHGTAEDVLARDPDLILAGAYTTPATVDLLRRLGRRVVVVPLPETLTGVRDVIGAIAEAAGVTEAGVALVGRMDARIAAVQALVARDAVRPTAVVYQVNNYVTGRHSLLDTAMEIAGFRNEGRELATFANGQTSLEQIVAKPPDVLVLATKPETYATVVADNLRHPALARVMARTPNLVLPWPLWLCGTQHIATAIEQLAQTRAALLARRKGL
jgi:iron complex transport system substrate-binding protein